MASQKSNTSKGSSKRVKYRKAAGAPKRFKSAYMFYSERKHKELRSTDECKKMRTADVAKIVSKEWKALPSSDRLVFLELARKDKERYEIEKKNYKGPWKVIDQVGMEDETHSEGSISSSARGSRSSQIEGVALEAYPASNNRGISTLTFDMWGDNTVPLSFSRQVPDAHRVSLNECNGNMDNLSVGSFVPPLDSLGNELSTGLPNTAIDLSTTAGPERLWAATFQDGSDAAPKNVIELPDRVGYPFPLTPLIPTDVGGYLAAAAMFDSLSESIFD